MLTDGAARLEANHHAPAQLLQMFRVLSEPGAAVHRILVLRDGDTLLDCALNSCTREELHPVFSCTKTVLGILVGIASDEGLIGGVHQPLVSFLPADHPAKRDPAKAAIRLNHLLEMTAGFDVSDVGGEAATHLMMVNQPDLMNHLLTGPQLTPAGREFRYNNAGSHVLACILRQVTGQTLLAFAQDRLFGPLGIENIRWEQQSETGECGWSGLWMSARDLAKVGDLVLQGGLWRGRRLISQAWLDAATRRRVAARPHAGYGYHWWVEPDYFMAVGLYGQYLVVSPQKRTVIVINSGLGRNGVLLPKHLLQRFILPAFESVDAWVNDSGARVALRESVEREEFLSRERGFVWTERSKGTFSNGEFKRTAAPAFRFRCPSGVVKQPVIVDSQVAALRTLDGASVFSFVAAKPIGVSLADTAAVYSRFLQASTGARFCQMEANWPILLAGGVEAYRSDLRYELPGAPPCRAGLVSVFQGDRWICVEAHTPGDLRALDEVLGSLVLEGEALDEKGVHLGSDYDTQMLETAEERRLSPERRVVAGRETDVREPVHESADGHLGGQPSEGRAEADVLARTER